MDGLFFIFVLFRVPFDMFDASLWYFSLFWLRGEREGVRGVPHALKRGTIHMVLQLRGGQ